MSFSQHHFDRRARAAEAGRHLPTTSELALGMGFLCSSLKTDSDEWAERTLRQLAKLIAGSDVEYPCLLELRAALEMLILQCTREQLKALIDAFTTCIRDIGSNVGWKAITRFSTLDTMLQDGLFRARIYAISVAHDPDVLGSIAYHMLLHPSSSGEIARTVPTLLGWAKAAFHTRSYMLQPDMAFSHGRELMREVTAGEVAQLTGLKTAQPGAQSKPRDDVSAPDWFDPTRLEDLDRSSVVVFTAIGDPDTGEGKRVVLQYKDLIDEPLPRGRTPDLGEVRELLNREMAHAAPVIDAVLSSLVGREYIEIAPIALVGSPGCGKTYFAGRLAEVLGLGFEIFGCGGVSDGSIAGTPRRWSTGEPSMPVSLCRRWKTASPMIILDELEKAGTGRHNGNTFDALLGLLEPESARRYFDPYVHAAVDLSGVIWIGTANSAIGLMGPLKDRMRLIAFPDPGPEHLEGLAPQLLRKLVRQRGITDDRWIQPLDDMEMDALRAAWPGGSIRRLARLVGGVLVARESIEMAH